jgi:hypothetical protein
MACLSQRGHRSILVLLAAALAHVLAVGEAFAVPHVAPNSRRYLPNCYAAAAAAAADENDSEAQQVQAMEDLILSLSADADDVSRRGKVASLFEEKLKNRDSSESFIHLFDQVLVIVGDRVRMEAVSQHQVAAAEKEKTKSDEKLPSFPLPDQHKSETELRLWALVDMMVQSKTIVKKATGQLGSEGSFG